jgi:hypothetical protein
VGGAVVLLLVEALPYLYPHYCLEETFPTIQTVHAYEHRTGLVGVDPEGSYFPITVQQRPDGSPLETDYQAGRAPERFDQSRLPEGVVVESINYRPTSAVVTLTTPEPFQARYLTFAFPGWTAEVDGQPVPITPDTPQGLITFPVPAGRHTIEVRWQMTPIRTVMMVITLLCLAGTVLVTLRLPPVTQFAKLPPVTQFAKLPYKTLLITGLLFLALKLLLIDRLETPIRREAGPVVENTVIVRANELQLAGYNLQAESVAAGETFDIDLAWQTFSQPAVNYQSNVWLVGPEGQVWSEKETNRPRIYETTAPTTLWVGGQWAWDSREVQVLPGPPPGEYDIVLTLFHLAD